jgi:hypothetical protein
MATDTGCRLSVTDTGEAKNSANAASISAAKSPDTVSAQDTDAILTACLRVFAARGRAIREERAKLKAARLLGANAPNVLGDQEAGSTDRENNKVMPSP